MMEKLQRDDAQTEVPAPIQLRLNTLQSIRKRLAIVRAEQANLSDRVDFDLSEETAMYLKGLRQKLMKHQSSHLMHAMQGLLKELDAELVRRGVVPDEHIEWVIDQLKSDQSVT